MNQFLTAHHAGRATLLLLAALVPAPLAPMQAAEQPAAQPRPNILFIVADDKY